MIARLSGDGRLDSLSDVICNIEISYLLDYDSLRSFFFSALSFIADEYSIIILLTVIFQAASMIKAFSCANNIVIDFWRDKIVKSIR